jgi:hypothetical protein
MVDYVGDMMKPYQNGVDRIQGGVYTDVQHITKCFRFSFFRFYFHQRTHSPNGWSDFDGKWLKRRDLAEGCAFWGSE